MRDDGAVPLCPTCGEPGVPVLFGRKVSDYDEVYREGLLIDGLCVAPGNGPYWGCFDNHLWPADDEEPHRAAIDDAFRGRPFCPLCRGPSLEVVHPRNAEYHVEEIAAGEMVIIDDDGGKRLCRTCGYRWNPLDELTPRYVWFFELTRPVPADAPAVRIEVVTGKAVAEIEKMLQADPEPFVDAEGLVGWSLVAILCRDRLYVARHQGELVGCLRGKVGPRGVAYTETIAIRREFRGLGIGARLWRAFADDAVAAGAHEARAVADPDKTEAIAFHLALGMTSHIVENYDGPKRDRIVMSMPL